MRSGALVLRVAATVLVVGGVCGACSPQPSAETKALEPHLLSVGEVGEGFTAERGGQVSYGIGHLCPETDVSIDGVGAVKAWFVKPNGDYEISVEEHLWTDTPERLDALMADLKTAFDECDGVQWEYYGETMVRDVLTVPTVGDDQIAVRQWTPDDDRDVEDWRIVYVRSGDTMAAISFHEGRSDGTAPRAMSDEECNVIVATAVDKLPN
jgi:hypothetical protein